MKDKKNTIFTILFIVLLFYAYYFVLKDYSIGKFFKAFSECQHIYLLLGIFCILLWVLFESIFMKTIFKKLGYHISWYQALGYVFTETYFSAVTPGSSGGQPVQLYEMGRDKIPYRISSIVIFINTMFYKISLIVIGIVSFIVYFDNFWSLSSIFKIMALIGFIVDLSVISFFFLILCSKKLVMNITKFFIKILYRFKFIKNIEEIDNKINDYIDDFLQTASQIRKHKKIVLKSFSMVFLQRLSILMIFYFVSKAFGINSFTVFYAIAIQTFLTIAMDSIPIPGCLIVGEGLIMEINEALGIIKYSKDITLVFRGISDYLLVFISFIYYIIFHYKKRKKATIIKE